MQNVVLILFRLEHLTHTIENFDLSLKAIK